MATSQQTRQSQLFAAEDWKTIYTAFNQVNFSSYDFNTIRDAMVNYIRINYPESFNDWIESSEFVAIIDLLAYLGQSLAFRMDLNTRENFIDTATRRDSVFRLAKMLSYQPQRCIPASGLIKITSIITNQDMYDSGGVNLKNTTIVWNDSNNQDWYEQFILVLNATLNSTNTFGNPAKSGAVNNISTEIYNMNNTSVPTSVVPFTASVSGNSIDMELANVDFTAGTSTNILSSGSFYEIDPDPLNSWNIVYQNDGNGYGSANTGFFFYFKQGTSGHTDFLCDMSIPNRIIDLSQNNVNQTDVWVQTINTTGLVTTKWSKVSSVNGFNVIYNSLENSVRNIFSVISRDNNGTDQVSIRFADGNFGNIPLGIIRVWYRSSNNLTYQIKPTDISNQTFAFNYFDQLNNIWNVAFTTNLQYTVTNALGTESNYSIAQNAPQLYYTQNRMVNGEDYNLFPLQSAYILKNKAINRVYSGQSRYLDINDPTGNYNDLNVFCSDGILYYENDFSVVGVPYSTTINYNQIANNYVQPLVNGNFNNTEQAAELKNFYYYNYGVTSISTQYVWKTFTSTTTSCTGAFFPTSSTTAIAVGMGTSANNTFYQVQSGSLLKFTDINGQVVYASVVGIIGNGTGVNFTGKLTTGAGTITLSKPINSTFYPVGVIPTWRPNFTSTELANIVAAFGKSATFGIRYDKNLMSWNIITNDNLSSSSSFSLQYTGDTTSTNKDASWLVKAEWLGTTVGWKIYSRALRYIFESVNQNRFYFDNTAAVYDPTTGTSQKDYIDVLSINPNSNTGLALSQDYKWSITGQQIYPDGYMEPRSVKVTMYEQGNQGVPDNPTQFNDIVDPQTISSRMVFWSYDTGSDGYQYWNPLKLPLQNIFATAASVPPLTNAYWSTLTTPIIYVIDVAIFYLYSNATLTNVSSAYKMRIGRNGIKFLWNHTAATDQRINPAITNVIDMYVLTNAYDVNIRNWISTNGSSTSKPLPPTSAELKSLLSDLESYKQLTDQMIWHPVSYKVIFGQQSDQEYQVKFVVVKTFGTTYTDNEVKSMIIQTINLYFSLSNWDFGQSFFFTELAAYIHQTLASVVGSIVIVPLNANAKFGDLFEIQCNSDEIFISSAKVSDIQIVPALTETVLGISNGG